jgi:glucose/arabinose dehydrogenase
MRTRIFFCLAVTALSVSSAACAAGGLPTVQSGFSIQRIATVADQNGRGIARELAFASNGDLFVGTVGSDVYVVPHADASGAAGTPRIFAHFDDSPAAGVTLSGDSIYVGTQFAIWQIPYKSGDLRARSAPQRLASVRTSGISSDHVTTSVAVAKGALYASVGASCNACNHELDQTRATIGRVAGGTYFVIARNIRNAIALTANENTGALWEGNAGQDELPPGHPYEIFDDVSAHSLPVNYGWPYCYENRKGHDCAGVVVARVALPAYASPIGAAFYPQRPQGRYAFSTRYAGGAFVTLHGSWHGPGQGLPGFVAPSVVFIPMRGDAPITAVDWSDPNKQWSEFVGGYQAGGSDQRIGRPTGVAVGPQGDLFVADDATGAIYRIRPK